MSLPFVACYFHSCISRLVSVCFTSRFPLVVCSQFHSQPPCCVMPVPAEPEHYVYGGMMSDLIQSAGRQTPMQGSSQTQ